MGKVGIIGIIHIKGLTGLVAVPIIAVFTKYDLLMTRQRSLGSKDPIQDAAKALETICITPFSKYVAEGIQYSTVSSKPILVLQVIPKPMTSSDKKGHEKTLQDLVELTKAQVGKNLPEVAEIVMGIAQQISPKSKIESSIA